MKTRVISVEEAIGIVEGAMVTRAVTEEAHAAWRVLRAELRRQLTPAEALHRRIVVTDESAARATDPRAVDESDDAEVTRRERRPL